MSTRNDRPVAGRGWRPATIALVAVAVVAGIAGHSSASAPPGSDPAAAGSEPVGDAVPIAAGVEWRAGAGGAYAAVTSPQPVAVGDGVRTDGTGFAEVAYGDGSRSRLDVDTEFEVVALVDDAGNAVTRTVMGVGRTWHRVLAVGAANGGFEVETSQATATVRGTAFLTSCLTADSCDFTVMEGTVDVALADGTVITVVGPATLDVTNGVATGPVPVTWDVLFADPWLVANTDLDVAAGFADRATVFEAFGPAYASMAGAFEVTLTVSDVTCVISCSSDAPTVGEQTTGPLELSTSCVAGVCSLVGSAGVPYSFDGVTFTVTIPGSDFICFDDPNGNNVQDEGEATTKTVPFTNDVAIAPSAAEVRDGVYLVTSFVYHRVSTAETVADPCPIPEGLWAGMTITDDGSAVRTG